VQHILKLARCRDTTEVHQVSLSILPIKTPADELSNISTHTNRANVNKAICEAGNPSLISQHSHAACELLLQDYPHIWHINVQHFRLARPRSISLQRLVTPPLRRKVQQIIHTNNIVHIVHITNKSANVCYRIIFRTARSAWVIQTHIARTLDVNSGEVVPAGNICMAKS
jgi:hypothetical protein